MTNELEKHKTSWVTCEWCGDRRLKYPSEKKKTTHNFCSLQCFYEWRKANKKAELFNQIELFETHAEIIINSPKYGENRVLIDLEDVERCKNKVYSIAKCGNIFYAVFKLDNKTKRLHQYLLNCNGQTIDHINHNGLDNRKENLRIVSRSVITFNATKQVKLQVMKGVSIINLYDISDFTYEKEGDLEFWFDNGFEGSVYAVSRFGGFR